MAILNFVFVYFLRPGKELRKYGKVAIVTGATDGIGKAYALELAKRGLDVVLVSRTQAKLDAVQKEISDAVGGKIDVSTHAMDLTKVTDEALSEFEALVEGKDVAILVNNAGMSLDHPDYLETTSAEFNRDIDPYQLLRANGANEGCAPGNEGAPSRDRGKRWQCKRDPSVCGAAERLCGKQGVHQPVYEVDERGGQVVQRARAGPVSVFRHDEDIQDPQAEAGLRQRPRLGPARR